MGKKPASRELIEASLPTFNAERVDREKGVIYRVKMAGMVSENGRRYTPECYKKSAHLYEGCKCNVNHTPFDKQVPSQDRFGIWQGVEYSESPEPGLYGNIQYIKSHPMAGPVTEAAERKELNRAFGMSQRAYGADITRDSKGFVVNTIEEVKSVDLVADPATNKGLYESIQGTQTMKKTIRIWLDESCKFSRQKKELRLLSEGKYADLLDGEIELDEAVDPEKAISQAVWELCGKVYVQENVSDKQKLKAIGELIGIKEKLLFTESEEEPEDTEPQPKPQQIGNTRAIKICEQLEFQPSLKQLAILSELNESAAKMTAEEFARLADVKPESKVQSGTRMPIDESRNEVKPARTLDEFVAKCG